MDGALELGLEAVIEDGVVTLRPHTGIPENFVLSPAFVNAHSHLEYRGMLDQIESPDYWGFLREITALKLEQSAEQVRADTFKAANENRRAGIVAIIEHSDRPYAGEALASQGFGNPPSMVFQEVITFFEQGSPDAKLETCRRLAEAQQSVFGAEVFLTPHTGFTVDANTLRALGKAGAPVSVHVSETTAEEDLFRRGTGPIADFYRAHNMEPPTPGCSAVAWMAECGLAHPKSQFVHVCGIDDADIELLAANDVAIAHCPRSNLRLQCPIAPVRRMVEAGVRVGLGLDSCASGGPIDMFAEMRACLQASRDRGEPLSAEQVWRLSTVDGCKAVAFGRPDLPPLPWIKIHTEAAATTEDLMRSSPDHVEWLA